MKISESFSNTFFSIFSFIIIFVIIIPIILYHIGLYYILMGYLPNVDLIATVITKWGGPYNIWQFLYPDSVDTNAKFFSSTIINYFALIGLTYIVAKEANDNNDLFAGWSMAFFMCLITYLLPSPLIRIIMTAFPSNSTLSTILGFLTIILIIIFEGYIIKHFQQYIITFSKYILHFPKIFSI